MRILETLTRFVESMGDVLPIDRERDAEITELRRENARLNDLYQEVVKENSRLESECNDLSIKISRSQCQKEPLSDVAPFGLGTKPQTNGGKVRAMTNSQLAKYLSSIQNSGERAKWTPEDWVDWLGRNAMESVRE